MIPVRAVPVAVVPVDDAHLVRIARQILPSGQRHIGVVGEAAIIRRIVHLGLVLQHFLHKAAVIKAYGIAQQKNLLHNNHFSSFAMSVFSISSGAHTVLWRMGSVGSSAMDAGT